MGKRLLRLFVLIILAPLVYALVVEAYAFVRANITLESIKWFLIGFIPTLFLYPVVSLGKSPTLHFIEVFRHELAHAVVSALFFRPPTHFSVDIRDQAALRGRGTHPVGLTGPSGGDFFAVLAPYYLPLFTLPLLLLRPLAPESIHNIVDLLIGITYAFHLITGIVKDFRPRQTDIQSMGRIFSLVVVLLFHVLWLVIILGVVSGNTAGILTYFKSSAARARDAYEVVREAARREALPALERAWETVRQWVKNIVPEP